MKGPVAKVKCKSQMIGLQWITWHVDETSLTIDTIGTEYEIVREIGPDTSWETSNKCRYTCVLEMYRNCTLDFSNPRGELTKSWSCFQFTGILAKVDDHSLMGGHIGFRKGIRQARRSSRSTVGVVMGWCDTFSLKFSRETWHVCYSTWTQCNIWTAISVQPRLKVQKAVKWQHSLYSKQP